MLQQVTAGLGVCSVCLAHSPRPPPGPSALCPPTPVQVKLPCAKQREAILRLTLARHVREMGSQYVDSELLPTTSSSSSGSGDDGSSGGSPSGAASSGSGGSPAGTASGSGSRPGSTPTLRWLAERTEGFSGSDLVQLCSQAAAVPIQAMIE